MHRFEYDAGGSRTVKRDPTTTTIYAGEHYRCTGATNPSSNTVSCAEHQYGVFVGDRLIAEITKDATGNTDKQRYVHSDHLGSSTLITDETGAVIEKRSFKPFGQAKAAFTDTDLRAGFTGHEHDSELGLINMRGRMYDPKLRRFVTPDPFVTEPWNPAGLNRFAYVQNSPLNFVDPSGFEGEQQRAGGGGLGAEGTGGSGGGEGNGGGGSSGQDTNNRPMDSQGSPATAQSASGSYESGDGYGGNYFLDSAALVIPSEAPAGFAGVPGYSQPQGPMCMGQGPTSGMPADMGGVGTPQSGGSTQTQSGPTTSVGPHAQRSGDGSGQSSSAPAIAIGSGTLAAALPRAAGAPSLWELLGGYLTASVSFGMGALAALGSVAATSDSSRDSAGDDGAASPSDILKDAKPEGMSKPGMGSDKYSKPGGMDEANRDFNDLAKGRPIKDYGNGTRSATLSDGTTASVRPGSSEGSPTLQIDPSTGNSIKIRYR